MYTFVLLAFFGLLGVKQLRKGRRIFANNSNYILKYDLVIPSSQDRYIGDATADLFVKL